MTMKKKTKKKQINDTLKKVFNSPHLLVSILLLIIIVMISYTFYLTNSNRTFTFNGRGEHVSILNGAISLNHDANIFIGSHITYIAEEDVILVDYEIGYFLRRGLEYFPLVTILGEDERGFSLRLILQHNSIFNITELSRNRYFFDRASIRKLQNEGLFFIIKGTTIEGEEIFDKVELNLNQVSR